LAQDFNHLTDTALLQLYAAEKDSRYAGALLSRYTLRLFGVCFKYLKDEEDAKDMVQQVCVKAIAEMGKYPIENVGGWLYRIAQNACISKIRSHKYFVSSDILPDIREEDSPSDEFYWEIDAQHSRLAVALDQKLCISLFFLEKKSYQEIAELKGFAINEVKSNIQNGKRNLKIIMEQLEREAAYGRR
jgi:RNA polymerase sigma factor (sigma-70 family)